MHGTPAHHRAMHDDEFGVGRLPNIQFKTVCAQLERLFKAGNRIFRQLSRAPVSQYQHLFLHGYGLFCLVETPT